MDGICYRNSQGNCPWFSPMGEEDNVLILDAVRLIDHTPLSSHCKSRCPYSMGIYFGNPLLIKAGA